MTKTLTTLAAAAIVATAAIAAGVIGGLALGAIAAGSYGYGGYGPYYGPGYAPYAAYGPGCVIRRERVWDGWGWTIRRVRVCY